MRVLLGFEMSVCGIYEIRACQAREMYRSKHKARVPRASTADIVLYVTVLVTPADLQHNEGDAGEARLGLGVAFKEGGPSRNDHSGYLDSRQVRLPNNRIWGQKFGRSSELGSGGDLLCRKRASVVCSRS